MTDCSNSRAKGVLCVGRVYCDIIFTGLKQLPALGEEQFASAVSMQLGGGAFITASHLAALTRPVSLLATLPAGPFAQLAHNELSRSGINFEHCVSLESTDDPQLTVALSMGGERAFVTKRSGKALPVEKIDWQQHPTIGHLHIGEFATLVEHPSLVADARDAGVSVSLDCSWDDALFERTDLASFLLGVDVFLPNQAEFEKLKTRCSLNEVPLSVVKQGNEGAIAYIKGTSIKGAPVAVDVVDTTGAGDAFNAGFVHAWIDKCDIKQCLQLANQCGSNSVSRVGGASVLN